MQRHFQLSAVSAFRICERAGRTAHHRLRRERTTRSVLYRPCRSACSRHPSAMLPARARLGAASARPTVAVPTERSTRSRRLFVATARCELTEGRQPSPPRSAWMIPRTPRAAPPSSASRCHTRAPKPQRRRRTSAARADGHHRVGAGPSRLLSARHARSEGSTIDGVSVRGVSRESESVPKGVGAGGQAQEPK